MHFRIVLCKLKGTNHFYGRPPRTTSHLPTGRPVQVSRRFLRLLEQTGAGFLIHLHKLGYQFNLAGHLGENLVDYLALRKAMMSDKRTGEQFRQIMEDTEPEQE